MKANYQAGLSIRGHAPSFTVSVFLCAAVMLLAPRIFPMSSARAAEELQVVDYVDVGRYMGLWYEIAAIPAWFQSGCAYGTTATYILQDDGTVEVVNSCYSGKGGDITSKGQARVVDPETNAKLEVVFFNPGGRWLLSAPYWIIDLGADYEYAVVGDPTREYGWILSRTCSLPASTLLRIMAKLKSQGYDTDAFKFTEQPAENCGE